MKPFKHSFSVYFFIFLAMVCPLLFSCGKTKDVPQEITRLRAHQWYYFTHRGFYPIDLPQNAPEVAEKPWTEAIRISAAGNNSSDNCALVNRLGILDFTTGKPELFRDIMLFVDVKHRTIFCKNQGVGGNIIKKHNVSE